MNALVEAQNNSAVAFAGQDPFGYQGTEGSGQTTFMKFHGASGSFLAGQDDDEIDHGTQFAVDMMNARYRWLFWWDGENKATVDELLVNNPALYDQEPDWLPEDPDIDMTLEEIRKKQNDRSNNFSDGWSVQASITLRPVDGSEEEFTLNLNRGVALNGFHNLRKSFQRQYKMKQGLIPIIELDASSFKSKVAGVGKRYAPVLKIVDWASEEDLMSMAGENPADYAEEGADAPEAVEAETEAETPTEESSKPAGRRGRRGKKF